MSDDSEKTTVLKVDQSTLAAEMKKAKDEQACLILIRGTPQGQRFFLTKSDMIIGRDASADIVVSDASISRKHARLLCQADKWTITDLGSSNGTVVNGKKAEPQIPITLGKEDMLQVGNFVLKFLPAGELEILFYGQMSNAAHTDALTKIFNKGYLIEAVESEFKRARALKQDFSVVYFDIDHFKKVNDVHGHDGGDYVLKEFASVVKSKLIREKDVFARFGGEEFVLLLPGQNLQTAAETAERLRQAIEAYPFLYGGKQIPVTSSFGVALLSDQHATATDFLKAADQALYASKEGGRNRVTVAK